MDATIARNIDNLTALWKTVGEKHNSYTSLPNLDYSVVKDSQWPNRLWFTQALSNEVIAQAKNQLETMSEKMVVPIWDLNSKDFDSLLDKFNFQLRFQQTGMSLEPKQRMKTTDSFDLVKVSNASEAEDWSKTFRSSFGYEISPSTLLNTCDVITYHLAYKSQLPVGTALTYSTEGTLGIHAMGVPAQYRKQGIANEIMAKVINSAIGSGVDLLTLQASDKGKGLYMRLGFVEQFLIKNYTLQMMR